MDVDIALLRAFIAVAETGGFSTAAHRLFRSQSAVSMQVKKLEQATGVSLLHRDPTGVRLSEAGERFIAHARYLVAYHDRVLASFREEAPRGRARLAVMDDYATQVLPGVLADFARRYPEVQLEITTGFSRELLGGLGTDFDLVLATQPAGSRQGQVLRVERVDWVFSATHPLPVLDPLPLALLSPGNLFRDWAVDALDRAGIPWRVVLTTTSIAAAEAAAGAGMALAVAKAGSAAPGLRLVGAELGLPALPVAEIALHEAPRQLSPAAARLAGVLREALRH